MKKTGIQIIPAPQDGKDRYLIICMNENAYADFLAGEDDKSPVTAFDVFAKEKDKITSLTIELQDGVPKVVFTQE